MVGCLGFAPSSRRLRAGTSLSKFATLVAVCKYRDTKAELNHRDEVCEALADKRCRSIDFRRVSGTMIGASSIRYRNER